MKKPQLLQALFPIGANLAIIGALAKIFNYSYAPYIFTAGVAVIIFLHILDAFNKSKTDKRQQRLTRLGLINSMFLGVGAYFMFAGSNSWVVMVLIYALSIFYLSFRGKSKNYQD